MNIDAMIARLIDREGGFVDHPLDRGGPTCWGITRGTLAAWRRRPVNTADVRGLSRDEAGEIYRRLYWHDPGFDRLPAEALAEFMFDAGVNHGPAAATRTLQRVLDRAGFGPLAIDGRIGSITLEATRAALANRRPWLLLALCAERWEFYRALVALDSGQAAFIDGWETRLAKFVPTGGGGAWG